MNPIRLFVSEDEEEDEGPVRANPQPLRYLRGTESLVVTPEDSAREEGRGEEGPGPPRARTLEHIKEAESEVMVTQHSLLHTRPVGHTAQHTLELV